MKQTTVINTEDAKKISKKDLLRYAEDMKGTTEPTVFEYQLGSAFPAVTLLISPIIDAIEGPDPFLLVTINFEPESDIYMMIDTQTVISCVGDSAKTYDKDNILEVNYDVVEDEVFGLTISAGLGLKDAKIDHLWDIISQWNGAVARIFIPAFLDAAKRQKKQLGMMIKDLESIVDRKDLA